ncbi:MAG: class I SAM-dependent methyltransferase [Polyangiaceae bacterium]
MNTLTSSAVSTLLDSLFAKADLTDGLLRDEFAKRSPEEREAFMEGAKKDYRAFYGNVRELFLPVSAETGKLLYMLARSSKARSIVEYGTSFGISTIHLAAALKDNGGGKVIGSEFEPGKVTRARENLAAAGLSELVDIREGDALETLARDLPQSIDLVLLDGAKVLYPKILALVEPRLKAGALIIADNADDSPEFIERIRDPQNGYLSVQFSEDVELSIRL